MMCTPSVERLVVHVVCTCTCSTCSTALALLFISVQLLVVTVVVLFCIISHQWCAETTDLINSLYDDSRWNALAGVHACMGWWWW